VLQIGAAVLLATTAAEQEAAHSSVHVAVAPDGRVCGVVKAGKRLLGMAVLQRLLTAAQRAGRELHAALQRPLDEDEDGDADDSGMAA
jgi:exosome complex RNA-binding protein Rrp42 (RNase PH superfamily)